MTYLTELEQARLDDQAAGGRGAHPQLRPLPAQGWLPIRRWLLRTTGVPAKPKALPITNLLPLRSSVPPSPRKSNPALVRLVLGLLPAERLQDSDFPSLYAHFLIEQMRQLTPGALPQCVFCSYFLGEIAQPMASQMGINKWIPPP